MSLVYKCIVFVFIKDLNEEKIVPTLLRVWQVVIPFNVIVDISIKCLVIELKLLYCKL